MSLIKPIVLIQTLTLQDSIASFTKQHKRVMSLIKPIVFIQTLQDSIASFTKQHKRVMSLKQAAEKVKASRPSIKSINYKKVNRKAAFVRIVSPHCLGCALLVSWPV